MTHIHLDELIHLANKDLELFEKKRLEIITSFMNSFSCSPAIKELNKIQKNINDKVEFHKLKDSDVFEQERQDMIDSFIDTFSADMDKNALLSIQNKIDSKMNLAN